MNVLLKSATIIDAQSDFHNQVVDILIEEGTITTIAKNISNSNNYEEIHLENLHVSQGWFDSSVSFGEPGYENRETIDNGLNTAATSGFTAVVLNANSYPVIDNYGAVALVKAKASEHATRLYPIGALTKGSDSIDLAELYDMKNAGAVAFYDYQKPISNPNLLKVALQYASNFNGLVCSFPEESKISEHGIVNEHINSTKLGLKGIPNLAEELQISRDIAILEYTGGKLHIPTLSTAKSVDLIREAKTKNLDITCSVAIHHLVLTDNVLNDFDTNYKVLPPIRTQNDCNALIEGLKDGTIDMVTSDHNPIDIEHKKVEFDNAMYGTIGLESAYGVLQNIFSTEDVVSFLTQQKSRFGVAEHSISVGNTADLTLFNPEKEYTFTKDNIRSTSKNSAFIGSKLKGVAYGIIANNKIVVQK